MQQLTDDVEIEELNALNGFAFSNLTFRSYQFVLSQLRAGGNWIGLGAMVDGKAAGLVLGEAFNGKATILSIAVAKGYQGRGIGTRLLLAIEKELAERAVPSITLTYVTGRPTTAALIRIMAKCGWPAAEPKHLVCTSDKRMYTAPWMQNYKLPPEFEVFKWVDITADERAALQRSQETGNWIPKGLSPFDYEGSLEPANSLGIRFKGEVVGWLITQPREPDTVCYSCSYLRPDLQKRARLVAVYAEGVRHQVAFTNKPFGIWIVPFKHGPMANFVLRRMRPWLISLEEFHESKKPMSQPVSAELTQGREERLAS